MSKENLKLPDMSGEHQYCISDGELEKIKSKLFHPPKPCDWCGHSNYWRVSGMVYTDVTFDVVGDRHIRTKVHPYFLVHCDNCGNTKRFCTKHFGLTTKGGV